MDNYVESDFLSHDVEVLPIHKCQEPSSQWGQKAAGICHPKREE